MCSCKYRWHVCTSRTDRCGALTGAHTRTPGAHVRAPHPHAAYRASGPIWLSLPGSLGWRGPQDWRCELRSVVGGVGSGPQEVPSARHPLTSPSFLRSMLTRAHPQTVCGVHVWCSGAHAVRVWRACVSLSRASRLARRGMRGAQLHACWAGRARLDEPVAPPLPSTPLPSKPSLSSLTSHTGDSGSLTPPRTLPSSSSTRV